MGGEILSFRESLIRQVRSSSFFAREVIKVLQAQFKLEFKHPISNRDIDLKKLSDEQVKEIALELLTIYPSEGIDLKNIYPVS